MPILNISNHAAFPISSGEGGKRLDRLVAEGTLEPVEHSEWTAPIAAVLKPDKQSVRICGDFKQTVSKVTKLDRYPFLMWRTCLQTSSG